MTAIAAHSTPSAGREVTVRGAHFIQEDSPAEITAAIDDFLREVASFDPHS